MGKWGYSYNPIYGRFFYLIYNWIRGPSCMLSRTCYVVSCKTTKLFHFEKVNQFFSSVTDMGCDQRF